MCSLSLFPSSCDAGSLTATDKLSNAEFINAQKMSCMDNLNTCI
jgi:hypothetical protein